MVVVNVLVGIAMVVGLIGAVVQVVPSGIVLAVALLVWGIAEGGTLVWAIVVTGLLVLAASTALKYAIPGKRLVKSGTPNSTLLLALAVGVVGWFVVPVLGLPLGALGAVYLLERHRLGAHAEAWSATLDVLKSLGLSILIEVVAALVVASLWILGLLLV